MAYVVARAKAGRVCVDMWLEERKAGVFTWILWLKWQKAEVMRVDVRGLCVERGR